MVAAILGHEYGPKAMALPAGLFPLMKEVARHILRRPVVGIAAVARTTGGDVVLIRRTDTGQWALPGGTLEWNETLRDACRRELLEEAGAETVSLGDVVGVYSDPVRDRRFHAVTIVVEATVLEPNREPMNPAEIAEVKCFAPDALPSVLAHGMSEMLADGLAGRRRWE
ncbi:MAG: NUDIX hydrolase [Polyangiaceae bacterium]